MFQFGLSTSQNNFQPLALLQQPQTLYQLRQLADKSNEQFKTGQRQVFNMTAAFVLPAVSTNNLGQPTSEPQIISQELLSLDALGGNENTFVPTSIQRFLKSKGKSVLVVASPAVAAQFLDGGRTAHSAMKILISINSESTCNIDAGSQFAHELCETHLLICTKE